jgi:hypothetical protein
MILLRFFYCCANAELRLCIGNFPKYVLILVLIIIFWKWILLKTCDYLLKKIDGIQCINYNCHLLIIGCNSIW